MLDPVTLERIQKDPVNFLLKQLQEIKTGYYLDGDGHPCLEITSDPDNTLQRLVDDTGKPSLRTRSFLRSVFRYKTDEKLHIGTPELLLVVDYLVEEAFKGGRKIVRTDIAKEGDYNFEAVVVFANSLRPSDDQQKGLGNRLLDEILKGEKEQLQPKITRNREQHTLVADLRTADLWRAINSADIEIQVQADKATLFNAINFFSRRLGELEEQFRKVGLDVVVSHRELGSWVTITRRDQVFLPDQFILVTAADGNQPSASGTPSGLNTNAGKSLDVTDDNRIEVEESVNPNAA
jgi:hypothetical protein